MSVEDLIVLKNEIDLKQIYCGKTKVVCIDGPAGSGKTTLAKALSGVLEKCFVIHMDDLYQGWEDALSKQFEVNLLNWIIKPLRQGRQIELQKYNWVTSTQGEIIKIEPSNYLILEGVGSINDETKALASFKIWLEVEKDLGLARVLSRDGEQIRTEMIEWQKKETEYFEANSTKSICDIWINGNPALEIDTSSLFVRISR
jgi:uridine kinase